MALVYALFEVLCNDDSEYWPLVKRSVTIMIETSQIITGKGPDLNSLEEFQDRFLTPALANQALFDYLAEKISNICYERSWYAKKAGCLIINLLLNKMPLVWTMKQCLLFNKSIIFILVSVTDEVKIYFFLVLFYY